MVDGMVVDGAAIDVHNGISVIRDDRLDLMMMKCELRIRGATGLVNPKPVEEPTVYISGETWEAICEYDEAEEQFYHDLEDPTRVLDWINTGPLMRYMVTDSGKYGEAARAARQRSAGVEEVDVLEKLARELQGLVTQAAEMRSRPSSAQALSFGHRLGEMAERVEEQRQQLARVQALLDFARVAVMDVADLAPANGRNGRSGS